MNYLRKSLGEPGFMVNGGDMSYKCPKCGFLFTLLSLMRVAGHSASSSKRDNKDPCVNNMSSVDGDG